MHNMLTITFGFITSIIIFCLGTFGMFIGSKDIILILISLELILLSVNINLVYFSVQIDDILGQIYCLFVLTVAAAETAIGLAIVIVYYRLRGGISIDLISYIKS